MNVFRHIIYLNYTSFNKMGKGIKYIYLGLMFCVILIMVIVKMAYKFLVILKLLKQTYDF